MPSIEECFECAPKLAQQIVNYWASYKLRDNPPTFTGEFEALVTKADDYQRAKERADKYRKSKLWNEREHAAQEATPRQAFAEAYKIFVGKHPEAASWFPGT